MLLILGLSFLLTPAQAQNDVIIQGFYWNSHPGDISDDNTGGIWWDTLAAVAPVLGNAGFSTIWAPPPQKSFAGRFDMGYGPYDYFDLGEFNSKGTIRTRHGNRAELDAMITAMHNNGVRVMADIVLNHRAGGDDMAFEEAGPDFRFLIFNPPSGRLPSGPEDFHPNNVHPTEDPPFFNPIFFEDICYFNVPTTTPPTNPDGTPGPWYFGAPNEIGEMGVDLIGWGRYLIQDIGFDELRLDAVKHIEPDYLAKFILEMNTGTQPFALGEFFDFDTGALTFYHGTVENSDNTGGIKQPDMSLFDFPLRGTLQGILNNTTGSSDLFQALGGAGLVWGSSLSGDDVVTWLDTHDTDRTGYVGDFDGCEIPFGNGCLKFETESDHNPIFSDKEDMGYPFLLAAEGRPIVFWKDYFWFELNDEIDWLLNLRNQFAGGSSDHIQNMNGFWPQDPPYDFDNNGGNMFAMRRDGTTGGESNGLVLGLNDHPSKTNAVFVNTPFTDKYLKDYSDGFMFETSQAFGDSRALVKAQARDYSWYAPTGLYPSRTTSHFQMNATPGGCPHFIALQASNAVNLQVNGAAIENGDEVAVRNQAGQTVGIGRVGQGFKWDGVHDMIIEVLGAPSTYGMAENEAFRIFVYDASAGQEMEIGTVSFAASGTAFDFSPSRPNSPNRNGNFATFPITTTNEGTFTCEGITLVSAFGAASTDCVVTNIEVGVQTNCISDTYTQELTISYINAPMGVPLDVNGQVFQLTGSPQTIVLTNLTADGAEVNVTASLGVGCDLTLNNLFQAPASCSGSSSCQTSNASASVYDDGIQSGDNDGSGFGSWIVTTQNNNPSTGGVFVFSSTNNGDGDGNGDGDIDTGGEAWGLYANSGDVSNLIRPLTTAFHTDSLYFTLDLGFVQAGGTVGFGLQNSSGENLLEIFFRGGEASLERVDENGSSFLSGVSFSDEGFAFEFVLSNESNGAYEISITSLGTGVTTTFSGNLISQPGGMGITQVRFFNANSGSDGSNNAYVNNLQLCDRSATLTLQTALQGRSDFSGSYQVDIYDAMDNSLRYSTAEQAPANGEFTFNGLDVSNYKIAVKHPQYLKAVQTQNIFTGSNSLVFGPLLAGDANDDNFVSALDFSVLATAFNTQNGDSDFDARADFNDDNFVTALDFSLLATNFNQAGENPLTALATEVRNQDHYIPIDEVDMVLKQLPGGNFKEIKVLIQLQSGDQPVDAAEAHLSFNPNLMEVTGVELGKSFPLVLNEQFDNQNGTIDLALGTLAGFPVGAIDFAWVTFRMKTKQQADLSFSQNKGLTSEVTFHGESVLGSMYNLDLNNNLNTEELQVWVEPTVVQDQASIYVSRAEGRKVRIEIVDVQGILLDTVFSGLLSESITNRFEWNSAEVEGGIYFVRVTTSDGQMEVKKIAVVR